jgi:hypothetical protein
MKGLSKGIEKSKHLVTDSMKGLTAEMALNSPVLMSSPNLHSLVNTTQRAPVLATETAGVGQTQPKITQTTIEVPLYINGREFARATGEYIEDELTRRIGNQIRSRGGNW